MASMAQPLTVTGIKAFAWAIAKRHDNCIFNEETGPGHTWWASFKKRHIGEITIRKADILDRGRSRMANVTVMAKHFKLLDETLTKHGIKNKYNRIYNCDESGMALDRMTSKVIVQRKTKQAYAESKGSRDHITVHTCVSASGHVIPPFIIFEKSFPSGPYSRTGPDGAVYAVSPNGYMDTELFFLWVKKQFIPETAHVPKPILLILDGHGSHVHPDVIDLLVENKIVLYCLPPHTTNILQPLDVAIFKPLKTKFSKITDLVKLASLCSPTPLNVSKKNFTTLFKVAFEQCMNLITVKNGFRKCGIAPFDPDAIDKKRLMPSTQSSSSHQTEQSLSSLHSEPTTSTTSSNELPTPDITNDPTTDVAATSNTQSSNVATTSNVQSSNVATTSDSPIPVVRPPTLPGASCIVTLLQPKRISNNPLVATGVIPAELVDCFITPETNKSKKEKNTRVITEARVLTSEEHRKLFRDKLNQKLSEEAAKEKRKEERTKKRLEKERLEEEKKKKKAERDAKKAEREAAKKAEREAANKENNARRERIKIAFRRLTKDSDGSDDDEQARSTRKRRRPARYSSESEEGSATSSSSSESSDSDPETTRQTKCGICKKKKGPERKKRRVEWIGCDTCNLWFHIECEGASKEDQAAPEYHCKACKNF